MNTIPKKQIDSHAEWVRTSGASGTRLSTPRGANLRGANLRGANLRGANLEGANLRWANLRGADLRGANLECANLECANLEGANLECTNLWCSNLRGADLEGANLRGANLRGANLRGANLRGANLEGADLRHADLRGADLKGANLEGADLRHADLRGAKSICPIVAARLLVPPQVGSFRAFKKLGNGVVAELEIPAHASRSSSTGRQCRASEALVISGAGPSAHDPAFTYSPGATVKPRSWDPDRWEECAGGIHFFMTREEAEAHHP